MGMFASPNRAAIMNSLPKEHRGAGGAMNQTFQNSAQVLSIGIFFTLMIIGLASTLPETLTSGLRGARRARRDRRARRRAARRSRSCSPPSWATTRSRAWSARTRSTRLSAHDRAALTGPDFFPQLISAPFRDGLHTAFAFAIIACLVAAAASALRGGRFHYGEVALVSRPEEHTCTLSGTASRPSACRRVA